MGETEAGEEASGEDMGEIETVEEGPTATRSGEGERERLVPLPLPLVDAPNPKT